MPLLLIQFQEKKKTIRFSQSKDSWLEPIYLEIYLFENCCNIKIFSLCQRIKEKRFLFEYLCCYSIKKQFILYILSFHTVYIQRGESFSWILSFAISNFSNIWLFWCSNQQVKFKTSNEWFSKRVALEQVMSDFRKSKHVIFKQVARDRWLINK